MRGIVIGGPCVVWAGVLLGCGSSSTPPAADDTTTSGTTAAPTPGSESGPADDSGGSSGGEQPPTTARVTHRFDPIVLAPFEESLPCMSWTIDNEHPLYVQAVTLANTGSFHHSNGFVVPEDMYPGPDGVWACDERGFNTLDAATSGTVLYAQSTQSFVEEQRFVDGAVIKIPARYKVVTELHMLNLAPIEVETELRVTFDLIHPRDVETVLTPFALQYSDLRIPAMSQSHFTGRCDDLAEKYGNSGIPWDFELHWALPHYHYLGNYFRLEVVGGAHDGEVVQQIEGFDAMQIGKRFDPPLDLSDADGLRFTCGYDNWRDQEVGWGNGDQEMCILFGFGKSERIFQSAVSVGSITGTEGDIVQFEGDCFTITAPRQPEQGPPAPEELEAPLNLPPLDPDDQGLPPVPPCEDADPTVEPVGEATLTAIRETIFVPACGFSSCHGTGGAAGGLDLESPTLHADLLGHEVQGNDSLPLVAPGDPEGSWLYQRVAQCEPRDDAGNVVPHMPLNAPFLLDHETIARLRAWIEAGAPDG